MKTKICVDCNYHRKSVVNTLEDKCYHPSALLSSSKKQAQKTYISCYLMRNSKCPSAKYFESK